MKKLCTLILSTAFITSCSGYSFTQSPGTLGNIRPDGWAAISHGNNVTPDYSMVFPQAKVNRLDLKIEAEDWQLMQDNMKTLFGDSANRQGMGPGLSRSPRPSRSSSANPSGSSSPIPSISGVPSVMPSAGPSDMPFPMPSGMIFPSGMTFPSGTFSPPAGGEFPGGGRGLDMEENPIYRPCNLKFEGKTWYHIGVRFKGNSSIRSSWGKTLKLPFRFDFDQFEADYPEIKNQRFYGFKRISMSSGFSDNSLIREKVAADIFREAGVPSAQTAFYRLFVDYGEGSKYFGLYTMVEIPDEPMFQTQFKATGGNLYKPSGNGAMFGTFDQTSFPKKTNEDQANWGDIQAIFTALHASRDDAAKWRAGLERVFDVKGFLRWLAVNKVIENWDTYGAMAHNYYLYNDPGDNLVHWIPWDNNMAMGGSSGIGGMPDGFNPAPQPTTSISPQPSGSSIPETTVSASPPTSGSGTPQPSVSPSAQAQQNRPQGGGMGRSSSIYLTKDEVGDNWPLIRYLIDDPVYKSQYVEFVEETINGAFAIEKSKARFKKAQDLIRNYVTGSEGEVSGYTLLNSPQDFESSLDALYKHVESRHEAVKKFLSENK